MYQRNVIQSLLSEKRKRRSSFGKRDEIRGLFYEQKKKI